MENKKTASEVFGKRLKEQRVDIKKSLAKIKTLQGIFCCIEYLEIE